MTVEEIKQKLAREKLVETGIGFVSEKTFREIAEAILPMTSPPNIEKLTFQGIRLIKNPFIADGVIIPFEKWKLGVPKKKYPL